MNFEDQFFSNTWLDLLRRRPLNDLFLLINFVPFKVKLDLHNPNAHQCNPYDYYNLDNPHKPFGELRFLLLKRFNYILKSQFNYHLTFGILLIRGEAVWPQSLVVARYFEKDFHNLIYTFFLFLIDTGLIHQWRMWPSSNESRS